MADFEFNSPDWELLRNAVASPVRQLIAVEVDSVARARATIGTLQSLDPSRPGCTLDLNPAEMGADAVLTQAAQKVNEWGDRLGLVFILDQTPATDDNQAADRARDFWRRMNELREQWDALNAQVLLLLLPANYRRLGQHADHLKRWIPLKIHLLGGEPDLALQERSQSMTAGMLDTMSPTVAREQLRRLQTELAEAIQKGASKSDLVRRFYMPMFAAAVSLHDLARANNLREKIDEDLISPTLRSRWLLLNCELTLSLFDLDTAQQFAEKLRAMGKETLGEEKMKQIEERATQLQNEDEASPGSDAST